MEERRLINEDGRPNFGIFSRPLNIINIDDLRPYGDTRSSSLKRHLLKVFRIKRWQYLGVVNPKIAFGSAIVSAGYLGNVFFYLYDRYKKELFEASFVTPFARSIVFEGSPDVGLIAFEDGKNQLKYDISPDTITLTLRYKNVLNADMRFMRVTEPLSVVVRESLDGFNYTNKEAGLEVDGEILLKEEKFSLEPKNSFGVLDYTIGKLSKETFWNWASGGGILNSGKRFGFNLSAGINETGITENAIWIEGRLHKLGTIKFEYSDLNIMNEWRITSNDNDLSFIFSPEGMRKANINAIFVKSKFFQPFGRFSGFIKLEKKKIELMDVYGFTEEHFAKW